MQEFVLGRICIYIWRLQRSLHIEQKELKNSLIKEKNKKAGPQLNVFNVEDEVAGESVSSAIDLVMRYEVTNENRLIKLYHFYHKLKEGEKWLL